ncbi:nucleoside permease NupC [Algibacter lectus]|uniref:Nucleoside permease NupC n=1 Tax=Algibacter lectus TaxID=221126 RepID=A0A090X553_9FLAO|nr:nucleoside permease NupC [Algibacter lectus]
MITVAFFLVLTTTLTAQDVNETITAKITQTTDSVSNALQDSLVVTKAELNVAQVAESVQPEPQVATATIIPSQGFTLNSLWRGVLGMVTLIFVAFLFSSNRKAIDWKIVVVGLAFQLLIAIGVLKVDL